MKKLRVASLVVDRANYGRLRPVLLELKNDVGIELSMICSGTMMLDRFGRAEKELTSDGLEICSRVYLEIEGSNPVTMSKSIGLGVIEFATEFARLQPDFLLVIGDRYEVLAAVIAAAYQNICVVHLQGGEVSGSIDESARHAVSRFAHYHFPSTERSKEYLIRSGEDPKTVFNFGCPVADVIAAADHRRRDSDFSKGVGYEIKPDEPYFLVILHPVTTQLEESGDDVLELLKVLDELKHPTIWLWPNIDAGADQISLRLRQYREKSSDSWLRLVKNFSPEMFQRVLANAKCAIGNSSSFVRDSSFIGTPVVLLGERQLGREIAENVVQVACKAPEIKAAILKQVQHDRFAPSKLYGAPGVSKKIVGKLKTLEPIHEKHLHYVFE